MRGRRSDDRGGVCRAGVYRNNYMSTVWLVTLSTSDCPDAVGTGEGWDIRRVGGSWTHCVDVASCATMTAGWGRSRSG